jgi:hypothetical protein
LSINFIGLTKSIPTQVRFELGLSHLPFCLFKYINVIHFIIRTALKPYILLQMSMYLGELTARRAWGPYAKVRLVEL